MIKTMNLIRRHLSIMLFFFTVAFFSRAQDIPVSGKVTDSNDSPIPGTSVNIEGTTIGTTTDKEGTYNINAPADANLVFNFIGYVPQTIPVNNRSVIDVVMETDIKKLDEVVVIGYGQMKRSDLTGSVVSVSSDAIEKSVTTTIDQVLQGRAAGVQVQQNSGAPGSSSSIRIRGISSLNLSNEPIFVIDGIIIDGSTGSETENALASINPSDIVSLDVLKDASATAIYGSRASNGVIIITTKRGQEGQASITYDGYTGWQEMPKKLDLLNLQEYAIHKNKRTELGIVMPDDHFVRPELLGEGTDWQEELFTRAMMTNHYLSASGGNKNSTYLLGVGYLDQ